MANSEYGDHVVLTSHLYGVTSYLPVHSFTETECNQSAIPLVTLTKHNLPWDPNYLSYEDQEKAIHDYWGKFVYSDPATRGLLIVINKITTSTCNDAADFTDDDNFANILESNVKTNIYDISNSDTSYVFIQSKRSNQVDYETLDKRWNIYLGRSNMTVTITTQPRVRICLYPTLGYRNPTND